MGPCKQAGLMTKKEEAVKYVIIFADEDRNMKLYKTGFRNLFSAETCIVCFTVAGPLLHQQVCQGWLAGSKELGEANGFDLNSAAAGVSHAADELGDAPGVMLQDCV